MELGPVSKIYYPLLNEFIRKGKRLISQKKLIGKVGQRISKQRYKVKKKFCEYESEHYRFEYSEETKVLNLVEITEPGKRKRNEDPKWWHILIDHASFDDILGSIKSRHRWDSSFTYEEEVDELFAKIKKGVAVDFFYLKQLGNFQKKISDACTLKTSEISDLYGRVEALWDNKHFPKIGDTVYFSYAGPVYDTGKLISTEPYDVTQELVKIEADNGNIISRKSSDISWPDKFEHSDLCLAMRVMLNDQVPDCWKENRLDFYS